MCTWYWPITILTIVLSYFVIHVAVKMLRVRTILALFFRGIYMCLIGSDDGSSFV